MQSKRCGLLLHLLWQGLSVCLSVSPCACVCLLELTVNPTKTETAEPIKMLMGMLTCEGTRNRLLDGG